MVNTDYAEMLEKCNRHFQDTDQQFWIGTNFDPADKDMRKALAAAARLRIF